MKSLLNDKKELLLVYLFLLILISLYTTMRIFNSEKVVLDEVKLKEKANNNESLAIMLEQEDGTYELSEANTFPSNMAYNSELSGCIDEVGNKLDNALDFDRDNNLAYVTTQTTTYCYLYFDNYKSISEVCNSSDSLSSCMTSSATKINNLWDSNLEDDGYRYVGTNPDNYICFGTSDKEECINDTDKYMYRIIGIFEDESGKEHLKLIKKEALNTAYAWHSDRTTDTAWNESDLYKGLNGEYFLTNTEYSYMQNVIWTNKISTWNYTMTNTLSYSNYASTGTYGLHYYHNTGKVVYLHELNRSSKIDQTCYYHVSTTADCSIGTWTNSNVKISLMYTSDYILSLGFEALSYTASLDYNILKSGWVHISNNDLGTSSAHEWTMSRYGAYKDGDYGASIVYLDGHVGSNYLTVKYQTRPVFYLEPQVEYLSGSGTLEDPIMIVE